VSGIWNQIKAAARKLTEVRLMIGARTKLSESGAVMREAVTLIALTS
jgi:hypothetical protein